MWQMFTKGICKKWKMYQEHPRKSMLEKCWRNVKKKMFMQGLCKKCEKEIISMCRECAGDVQKCLLREYAR